MTETPEMADSSKEKLVEKIAFFCEDRIFLWAVRSFSLKQPVYVLRYY